jgi:polyketide biosynthesis acyl carrier protein
MEKQAVFDIIVRQLRDVLPELSGRQIGYLDSLRALGANSIDRSEIIMGVREELALHMPLVAFAKAECIGDLADIMLDGLARA